MLDAVDQHLGGGGFLFRSAIVERKLRGSLLSIVVLQGVVEVHGWLGGLWRLGHLLLLLLRGSVVLLVQLVNFTKIGLGTNL